MATPVIMPRQGQSVESCIIAKWYKKKGDRVKVEDILFSYETDKASFDEEAKVNGVLLDVFFEEGDDVPCLTNVCVIGSEGENTEEFNHVSRNSLPAEDKSQQQNDQNNTTNIQDKNQPEITTTDAINDGGFIRISPRARNLAKKDGVDYRYAKPSGPCGRIIEKDIAALKEAGIMFTAPAREEQMKGDAGKAIEGTGLGGRTPPAI